MIFKHLAHAYLVKIGFKQGQTKTTEGSYRKGSIEIIINKKSFVRRKIFEGTVFSIIRVENAKIGMLKDVLTKQNKSIKIEPNG